MPLVVWFWLIETLLFLYCLCGSWMLQIMAYPTYHLVGDKEFVPFHVASGNRLIPVFVVPAVLGCLASVALPFFHPDEIPMWMGVVVSVCGVIILGTTLAIEVPKHQRLDKEGKSTELIDGLVRDNVPRAISWSVGASLMVTGLIKLLQR
jgi:hypothetical protein